MSAAPPVALVTGASSGIGRAFALLLAERGHDLVVVARDVMRLEELAEQIGPDRVEVLAADLTDDEGLAEVEDRLAEADRPVDLLVNNAGFGRTGRFVELPADGEEDQIRLNVMALTRLARAGLPPMIGRGRGGVINVSSIAGFAPAPVNATYGATKAYVTGLSLAIREELRGTGVRCLALCPGFTRTEFQARAGYASNRVPRLLWQDAPTVARAGLAGLERDAGIVVPGILNKLGIAGLRLVPHRMQARVVSSLVSRQV